MIKKLQWLLYCWLFSAFAYGYANTQTLSGIQIIEKPTVYSDTTLNLQNTSFLITNKATLTITHSTLKGTLSPENPKLFLLTDGTLNLRDNTVKISVKNIPPLPTKPPTYMLVSLQQGKVFLDKNRFTIDQPFTAGLLVTGAYPTSGITITENSIHNFHGGIVTMNASNAIISGNTFTHVSSGNIYIKNGHHIAARKNTIIFSGNNNVGDSFDIIDSDNISLTENRIFSGSCYSIFLLRSRNIYIDHNNISGGITYAIFIAGTENIESSQKKYLLNMEKLHPGAPRLADNRNITVSDNYLSQNRFGLAATQVDNIQVSNNQFIQHFKDNQSRQFWTNNDILLKNVTHMRWINNLYKEAFSQEIQDNNDGAMQFVPYPEHNGVQLEKHKV